MEKLTTENLILLVVAIALAAPFVLWIWRRTTNAMKDSEALERAERDKEEQSRLQQLVRAGTHDPHGYRLCITCGDKVTRATQSAFLVLQSEGIWDLVRRAFGAPARYIIKPVKNGVPVYCDQCATLVSLEHNEFVLRYEKKMREQKRDAALELRRWMKYGVNDVVARRIEEHDEAIKALTPEGPKSSVVVPLRGESLGG